MKNIRKIVLTFAIAIGFFVMCLPNIMVNAEEEKDNSSQEQSTITYATDEEKSYERGMLNRFYSDLKLRYNPSEEKLKEMDKMYNSAMSYIANASLAVSEIASYRASVEGYLEEMAEKNISGTEKFLMLSNEVPILSAKYNEETFVVLSFVNMGKTDITDVVITPTVSNDKKKWPFDIGQAYDAQCVQIMQASDTVEEAFEKRMDLGWMFKVRKDVLTGCYPLTFHATYYHDGAPTETDITTYINITGADPSKLLIEDPDRQKSNPRIIVTGYTTTPEVVYAGSTFELSVDVKNTSNSTTVKNVLFTLEATVEGSNNAPSYAAFLPTSGSSSVYAGNIAPGQTYNMGIEMEAKADLAQKPYVLTVKMKYDTDDELNVEDIQSVSIPIKQESKFDTGAAEVLPESIAVGEQSNVMFSIFNTGKTTLYNVKVTYTGDSIDGGIAYIGNLAPGATGNVDSTVTGVADAGPVAAVISYEDEAGNETSVEKELNLSVYEENFEEMPMEDETEFVEPAQESNMAVRIIIIVAVLVAIAVAVVIFLKKKAAKKKKEQEKELTIDEDDE